MSFRVAGLVAQQNPAINQGQSWLLDETSGLKLPDNDLVRKATTAL